MSADSRQVRVDETYGHVRSQESGTLVNVPTPQGTATGTVIDERWTPVFNDKDRELVRVDVEGTTLRVRAEEIERV